MGRPLDYRGFIGFEALGSTRAEQRLVEDVSLFGIRCVDARDGNSSLPSGAVA